MDILHRTRQFQTAPKKRSFFDRKVLHYGYSRMVSLGKIIPKDWTYIRVAIEEQDKTKIVISLTKLLGSEPIAQNKKVDKGN